MADLERIEAVLSGYRAMFEDMDTVPSFQSGGIAVIKGIEKTIERMKNEQEKDDE